MENPELDPQYPTRWVDYIGQPEAKIMLQVGAKSAKKRRAPMESLLITHPLPGVGKTALGHLAAGARGTTVRHESGPMSRDKARMILSQMKDNDVIVYDEFHEILEGGKKAWGWFLTYHNDGQISGPLGMEQYPRVTFICCTTDASKLPPPILSRLVRVPLVDYTPDEAAKIAVRLSASVFDGLGLRPLRKLEAVKLAAAAHNNPRAMQNLLKKLRDLLVTDVIAKTVYDMAALFDYSGVTPDGLDRDAQAYLTTLYEFGGKAGARTLGDQLAQPGGLALTERVLVDKKLIGKTTTGRVLTQDGINRARQLLKVAA